VDLDGDGCNDILSGSYSRMSQPMAGLFQVLWGKPDGSFKTASVLEGTDGEPLIIPATEDTIIENICTRPMAVDWDGDGDLDLVVGNFAGGFYLFTGEGKGRFSPKPQQILTESGSPLRINGHHSDPFPVDWDGDGDLDLVSGSSNGGVQWAQNVASAGQAPTFKSFRTLIELTKQVVPGKPLSEDELTGPTQSTRVWVDDVNSDGKLDILVGDDVTLVSIAAGLSEEEFNKKRAEWEKSSENISEELRAAGEDQEKLGKARAKFQAIYAQRSEFMTERATGFVWLYLQK
jgi:hypothetical protein